jgi:predicted DCC family thiol-disulfide oxidoreductase YuxK
MKKTGADTTGVFLPYPELRSGMAILFFDGVCNLCNGFVDWLIRHDRRRIFRYSPLQGETAAGLNAIMEERPDSIVLLDGGRAYVRSEAVIRIFENLGGFWKIVVVIKIVPVFMRDAAYDCIAARRYAIFGRRSACRLPSKAERDLFLP